MFIIVCAMSWVRYSIVTLLHGICITQEFDVNFHEMKHTDKNSLYFNNDINVCYRR
jgi:hypothetical protein